MFNPFHVPPQNMMSQFMKFKSTFQGDPREEVQKLLDSGKMSQEVFDSLSKQATELQNMFKMF